MNDNILSDEKCEVKLETYDTTLEANVYDVTSRMQDLKFESCIEKITICNCCFYERLSVVT